MNGERATVGVRQGQVNLFCVNSPDRGSAWVVAVSLCLVAPFTIAGLSFLEILSEKVSITRPQVEPLLRQTCQVRLLQFR